MKIEIHLLPTAKFHIAAAQVTDWLGLRVRRYRKVRTGNMPGGEWIEMNGKKLAPPGLTKKLNTALVQARHYNR